MAAQIAIVGAGGVGAYLGVLLQRQGVEATLLDKGTHLDAIKAEGVLVRSRGHGELRARLPATDDPSEVGPVDLLLFCVKTYDNDSAIPTLRPMVGPNTAILTVQNGVGNVEQLAQAYGADAVLGGALVGGGTRVAPGVIEHVLPPESEYLEVGGLEPGSSAHVELARAVLEPTGVAIRVVDDIQRTLWAKLLAMASLSALGCLTRLGTAQWRGHPATRELYATLVREAASVARAEGIALDDPTVDQALAQPDRLGPAHRTSLHADLERGQRLEVDAIHGEVVRRAERHGLATPTFRTAYAVLRQADDHAAGS